MTENIEKLIFEMLTESTGTHMLDSGGCSGRHWQRNQRRTIEDFRNDPAAVLVLDDESCEWPDAEISVFHWLTAGGFELDELAREFNRIECDVWNGDFYGTNADQCEWLDRLGFEATNDGWNTYNWDSLLSQTLQGTSFERDGDLYELIQIHNGADVRGGYTDAKLFRLGYDCDSAVYEYASFGPCGNDDEPLFVDWRCGEWTNQDGNLVDADDWRELWKNAETFKGDQRIVYGHIYH